MTEWIDSDDVRTALGLAPGDVSDDAWLDMCVAAVNQFVDDTRPVGINPPEVDGRTQWGAVQLATRWFSRRNSNDISAFVEYGGPPPSIDRDVEVALQINRYFGPVIA